MWQKGSVIVSSPSKSYSICELRSSFYTWIHLSFAWVKVLIVSEEICAITDPISCCRCQFWCCMKLSLFFYNTAMPYHQGKSLGMAPLVSQTHLNIGIRKSSPILSQKLWWASYSLFLNELIVYHLCLCSFYFCLLYIYLCLFFIWRSSSPDQRSCPVYRYPTLSPSFSSSFSSLSSTAKQTLSAE